jgi:dTMP kinase
VSLFVTFEGPEGAGKSTQVSRVAAELAAHGIEVCATREPGGTRIGDQIRKILLDPAEDAIVPETEALLLMAARAQHVATVVVPALHRDCLVLCDRYFDSTLAYQGAGRGIDEQRLESLQAFAAGSLRPDVTVLLDVPVDVGFQRRSESGEPLSRFDRDRREFHERVRSWYLHRAATEPDRWVVFDAMQPAEQLTAEISAAILQRTLYRSSRAVDGTRA